MSYLESICSVYRRVNMIDLFDLPFAVIHEMYRTAFLTSQEEKKKQEKEEEKKREQEAEERKRSRIEAQKASGGLSKSSVSKKHKESPTPQVDTDTFSGIGNINESDIEDLIEEGF